MKNKSFLSYIACVVVLYFVLLTQHMSVTAAAYDGFEAATDLSFNGDIEGPSVKFTTHSKGYYKILIACTTDSVKDKTVGITSEINYNANLTVNSLCLVAGMNYDYLGDYKLYVIGSPKSIPDSYQNIDDFKNDTACFVSELLITVKNRMPEPKNVVVPVSEKGITGNARVTWENDGFWHVVRATSMKTAKIVKTNHFDVPYMAGPCDVEITTMSNNLSLYANSNKIVRRIEFKNDNTNKENSYQSNATKVDSKKSIILPMATTVDGITYYVDKNGNAKVTHIADIKKVQIDHVTIEGKYFPVTSIAINAARGNKGLQRVVIGPRVKRIEKKAFYGCKKIKAVVINVDKTIFIGKNAFRKLGKNSMIYINGVKGKSKKKAVKMLIKQTNATVK